MVELDDNILTPDEMRAWLEQEVRDLTKSLELRIQDATDFATAYCAGRISGREATARLRRYDSRWGDPISGVYTSENMTNEEILRRLDDVKRDATRNTRVDRLRRESGSTNQRGTER
jgi:hypothetical protein